MIEFKVLNTFEDTANNRLILQLEQGYTQHDFSLVADLILDDITLDFIGADKAVGKQEFFQVMSQNFQHINHDYNVQGLISNADSGTCWGYHRGEDGAEIAFSHVYTFSGNPRKISVIRVFRVPTSMMSDHNGWARSSEKAQDD